MVSCNNGVSKLAPCFLNKWSRRATVTVDSCATVGTNGWCGLFKEGYGCKGNVRGVIHFVNKDDLGDKNISDEDR